MALSRILIANRGEIALRVLRACHELGIEAVAAYTQADRGLRHLDLADDAVCIGQSSYLDQTALIAAAQSRQCDAIHPGYGLLSENAEFARAVSDAGLTFIGPSADTMAKMGDKWLARDLVASLGLSVIPGEAVSAEDASVVATALGYPLMLKAAFGGGGRGLRLVSSPSELASAVEAATAEAEVGFGNGALYLEKFLAGARHIEVQILGDGRGGVVHLGARDCTLQRSHQKLVEESPPPEIDEALLATLVEDAAAVASKLEYLGAGTFEFLYQDRRFHFIEMNTRLQVEHPVTESVTGIDLVRAQIELAEGNGSLPTQCSIAASGHAIECRINAEAVDKEGGSMPSPGQISEMILPGGPGIRIDSHIYAGYTVPHQYDSLLMKVIAAGPDRRIALRRMRGALDECEIRGIDTNLPLLRNIMRHEAFVGGMIGPDIVRQVSATL